jgi:hypothetical protein
MVYNNHNFHCFHIHMRPWHSVEIENVEKLMRSCTHQARVVRDDTGRNQ